MTSKCSVCGKPLSENICMCRDCGALMCGDCAKKSADLCPDCFRGVAFFS